MTDKYEKLTGMTVGQVVQLMSEGVDLYRHRAGNRLVIDTSRAGIFIDSNTASMGLGSLRMELRYGNIYRKIEVPWWEKHVGSLVMARDSDDENWNPVFFGGCVDGRVCPLYDKNGVPWKQMRPLTAAEKDAIITEG